VRKPRQPPLSPGVLSTVHGAPREMPARYSRATGPRQHQGQPQRQRRRPCRRAQPARATQKRQCQVPVPAPAPAPARIAVKARIAKPRISPRLGLTVAIYHTDELDRAGAKEGARSRRVRVRKHDAWRGVEREGRLAAMRHMPCHVMQCRAMRLVVCKSRTLQVVRGHAGGRGCGAVVCVWWWWVQCR
jgi:hypothetical protein